MYMAVIFIDIAKLNCLVSVCVSIIKFFFVILSSASCDIYICLVTLEICINALHVIRIKK